MATRIEVDESPESVIATLEKAGEVVEVETEKPAEESTEKAKPAAEVEAKPKEAEAEPEKAKAKTEKKQEGAQKTDEEQDWDSLPEWAKKQITRLRSKNSDLRDRLEDKRAEEPARASAGAVTERTKDKESEPERTFSGIPEPKFEDFEKADDPYKAFTIAHSKWAKAEAVAEVKADNYARTQADAHERTMTAFDKRLEEAETLIPDFADVMEEAADIKASAAMQHVIYNSEVGPYILHHFAKNPDECRRIYALAPADAIKAMGRLESKVEAEVEKLKAKKAEPPKTKKVSAAPEPESTVRGGQPKSKSTAELAGSDDRHVDMIHGIDREYERKRAEQRRGR